MQLSKRERDALLRFRYAGRFDDLSKPKAYPAEEAREEVQVMHARSPVSYEMITSLQARGLLERRSTSYRLTDAGVAALKVTR